MEPKPAPVLEVFADIWCPFTHVGLKAVAEQRQVRGRADVPIWVRSWPLEWVNGRAMDPSAALAHAKELREQVSPELFSGLDASRFPRTTLPLLALAAEAYKVGPAVGESLSFEVRDALFERGLDVADPGTLIEMAASFGLKAPEPDDYATVVAEWKEGRARGVLGSPHFLCGASSVFCPSLDISSKSAGGGKAIRRNFGRLGAFLDECFSTAAGDADKTSGGTERNSSE
jgi:predicted DsbA family dithiol-disulfide isomerase